MSSSTCTRTSAHVVCGFMLTVARQWMTRQPCIAVESSLGLPRPRPSIMRREGLVSTACACASIMQNLQNLNTYGVHMNKWACTFTDITCTETVANTDISSYFSCEDLLQLERAGIPVLRELASKSVENHVAAATYKWLLAPGVNDTKPIWKYLLLNLEVLDLKDLIENIKCHLGMLTDERSGKVKNIHE